MLQRVVLFLTAMCLSLTAGRAFWVSVGENPFNMPGSTYVEFFQQLDQRIAIPIAITGVGGTLLAGIAAALYWARRRVRYLLLLAFGFSLGASAVTVIVSVPINLEVANWSADALPPGYDELLRQWWQWHQARMAGMMTATCLVFAAMLTVGSGGNVEDNPEVKR